MKPPRILAFLTLALVGALVFPGCGPDECEGGNCECSSGSCYFNCASENGAGCNMKCSGGAQCALDCPGGNCNFDCTDAYSCELSCAGGNCNLKCTGNTDSCTIFDCKNGCNLSCGGAKGCSPSCEMAQGCNTSPWGSGVAACSRGQASRQRRAVPLDAPRGKKIEAMRTHRQNVQIAADHRVTVVVPEDFPEGPAEILIRPVGSAPQSETFVRGTSGVDEEFARLFPLDPLLSQAVLQEDPTAPLTEEDDE